VSSGKFTASNAKLKSDIPKELSSPPTQMKFDRTAETALPKMDLDGKKEFSTYATIVSDKKRKWIILKGAYLLLFDTETGKKETGSILLQTLQIENLSPEIALRETTKSNIVKICTKKITYLSFDTLNEAILWGNAMRKAALRFTGATITVDPTGADKAEKTISNALIKAQPLDKIVIKPGTYHESLVITKTVCLEGGPGVIIQSLGAPAITCVVEGSTKVSSCVIESVLGNERGSDQISCVVIKTGCLTMTNCEIKGGKEAGVKTMAATHLTLHKTVVKGNRVGIMMRGYNMATIEGCLITGNDGDGVVLSNQCMLFFKWTALSSNEGNGLYLNGETIAILEHGRMSRNKLNGILSSSPKSIIQASTCEIYENNAGVVNEKGDVIQLDTSNTVDRNRK
jgi:hypothetical protein